MPSFAPSGDSSLLSHLLADQSQRWRRGERIRVKSYLKDYPDLASDGDALLDLVYAEVLLRLESGEHPTLAEYIADFPTHADTLRRRWAAHRLVMGPSADTSPPEFATVPLGPTRLPLTEGLPGYEILGVLGKGGMGVVYKARQPGLARPVAIKMMPAWRTATAAERTRFRNEMEAAGRIDHPNVVTVHCCGEQDGEPYLVMEYLSGGSLSRLLDKERMTPRQAAEMVARVARGVQAAHERGVVHRDLKPGNVLLDEQGTPHVADFGLAALADHDDRLTQVGEILGTAAYMAPEQASGAERKIGSLADVWAMGVILYHCLTGQVPFKGRNGRHTLALVEAGEYVSPRVVVPSLPSDLDRICRKCLQCDPAQRYASAAALAEDLERHLRGEKPTPKWLPAPLAWTARVLPPWRAALVGIVVVFGAAMLAMGPEPARADAQSRLEQKLRQDAPVVLIGQRSPAWSQDIVGKRSTRRTTDETGHFAVTADEVTMIELAADPQRDSYRLRAQIRHMLSHRAGDYIGLYVGRQSTGKGPGVPQQFTMVGFNDVFDEVKVHAEVMRFTGGNAKGPQQNGVWIVPRVIAGPDWKTIGTRGEDTKTECFSAHGDPNGPWRQLAVEVTPKGIRAFWEDEKDGKLIRTPAGELSLPAYRQSIERGLDIFPDFRKRGVQETYNPRGGLGLIIIHGTAAYRNVVIEPLEPRTP